MQVLSTMLLLSISVLSKADIYSSGESKASQLVKNELKSREQREHIKLRDNSEYAEQQRYLRQAEQDAKIRQQEDQQRKLQEEKRRWPEPFDVKHGFY